MRRFSLKARVVLVSIVTGILAASPALAEKPSRGGGDQDGYHPPNSMQERHDGNRNDDRRDSRNDNRRDDRGHQQFNDRHRVSIQDYYADEYRRGHCPPGLAKRHNGCVPRGQQARRWALGRQLPRDVVFYDLPPRVLVQLGPPPPRHRYVRVAQDILLLATGTGMVVDAIDNLNWEFAR